MKRSGFLNKLVSIICILIIIACAIGIFYILYPKFKAQKDFEDIAALSVSDKTINWEELIARNPDTVGWIQVPGTHINYPVVQTTDNDYYLNIDFDQNYSGYGTPFLDYTFNKDKQPPSQNAVIYAHASRDGDQVGFEGLDKFEDENYFKEHPYIYYTTPADGNQPIKYDIVAVIKEDAYFDYRQADFNDQSEFLNYYNRVLAHKLYDTGQVIYENDQVVTLSTCVFDLDNGRVALICRRAS